MEKDQIKFGVESIFHMIRHFEKIHTDDLVKLITSGYNQQQIDEEFNIYGSKFHELFADGIPALIKKVSISEYTKTTTANGNYQYFFPSINIKDNNDVGAVSVLPIELLSLEQKENIYIQENRGYKLKHIKVDQLPKTKEWTMILNPQTNNISYFITAFPGLPAMPIPRNDMNKNQKEDCIDFWNKHVFLVISNNSASS
jgi:hypothetical protein